MSSCFGAMIRGMLKVPAGAAVWGTFGIDPEAERTPPVRKPARRDARGLGAFAVAIVVEMRAMVREKKARVKVVTEYN